MLTSLELTAPTASDNVLGTGKWVIAPALAYGMFLPGNHIFAPAYKHSVSFAGQGGRPDINSGSLDFYFVSKFDHGRQWITIDPTYILTYGRVLGKVGGAVMSGYIKPGVGIGPDRPYTWSAEAGVSFIGF